eukprot:gene5470-5705_t
MPTPRDLAWCRLQADNGYEAVLKATDITRHTNSCLATLAEIELSDDDSTAAGVSNGATIRLNCCEETAREVVALLRHGHKYVPPDCERLRKSLQLECDRLGIASSNYFSAYDRHQEVLLLPAYVVGTDSPIIQAQVSSSTSTRNSSRKAPGKERQLLCYSSSANGWAEKEIAPGQWHSCYDSGDGNLWMASVLKREDTGASKWLLESADTVRQQ